MTTARLIVASNGFVVAAEDLGGDSPRQIVLGINSGYVWVRKPGVIQAGF